MKTSGSHRTSPRSPRDQVSGRRRAGFALGALFVVPLVLLLFAGNPWAVLLIYVSVCALGVAVVSLTLSGFSPASDAFGITGEVEADTGLAYPEIDKVETLAESVKSAGKGSEIARRELARLLARMLKNPREDSAAARNDPAFMQALTAVLLPYRPDLLAELNLGSGVKTEGPAPNMPAGKASPQIPNRKLAGRGEYLASLEVVAAKLDEMLGVRSG